MRNELNGLRPIYFLAFHRSARYVWVREKEEGVFEMTDMTVAHNIRNQLGGTLAMIGGKQLVGSADGLRIKVGTNPKRATHITIKLDKGTDTYIVMTSKYSPKTLMNTEMETIDFVYADCLRPIVGRMLGLDWRI